MPRIRGPHMHSTWAVSYATGYTSQLVTVSSSCVIHSSVIFNRSRLSDVKELTLASTSWKVRYSEKYFILLLSPALTEWRLFMMLRLNFFLYITSPASVNRHTRNSASKCQCSLNGTLPLFRRMHTTKRHRGIWNFLRRKFSEVTVCAQNASPFAQWIR